MNCELLQRQLLSSDSPGEPSAELQRHLAECPSCRAWQQQLVEMEQQLPLLLTPPSQRKEEVVRHFLDAVEPAASNGTVLPYAPILPFTPPPPRERGLRKASIAIAMAAGLALFALGWWAWQHIPEPPKTQDPLTQFRAKRDHLLTQAPTRRDKVEVLARLAEKHSQEALNLAQQGDTDKLTPTVQFYIELVRDNLPSHATALSASDRAAMLPGVADRLQETYSSIDRFLASSGNLTTKTRNELLQMRDEARNSQLQVQSIIPSEL
jgi:hypothetical protein